MVYTTVSSTSGAYTFGDSRTNGIASFGTNGLQSPSLAANAAKAGLPANFFVANPTNGQGNSYLDTNGGNTQFHALQFELRRRMSAGLLVQASYAYQLSRRDFRWSSMRDDWEYVESSSGPKHGLKFNWVFELPFGQGRKWGSGAGTWVNYLIGGWEFDGVGRLQSGTGFDYGNYRLVGMDEKDLQDMFKIYRRTDSTGKERIYTLPEDVIQNSILALYTAAATPSGYTGAAPTGRYLAPASGPDCVQLWQGYCPGTSASRVIWGPWYNKWDFSFVKRIPLKSHLRVEARMDLYNVFDAVNFLAVRTVGSTMSAWEVTGGARDLNASQDAGGRITQFGLRITW